MFAALPMYDWPEIMAETDAWWGRFRDALDGSLDLPDHLTRPDSEQDLKALWRNPGLIFAQTCWGPLKDGLEDSITILAQPDYSNVLGGRGPCYRSALVARKGDACSVPDTLDANLPLDPMAGQRFAFNSRGSLSGYQALGEDIAKHTNRSLEALFGDLVVADSHRGAVIAVADGRADFAAIDCRSWSLAMQHEPLSTQLHVVGWTAERLGLPYICAKNIDSGTVDILRRQLLKMGCHAPTDIP